MEEPILVIGLGEVGRPLMEVISERYDTIGIDLDPVEIHSECEIMHVCYPFVTDDFVNDTIQYIKKYKPRLTIINSTVAPGTTRSIYQSTGMPIVYSPVRGKHHKMKSELLHYVKFIGGIDKASSQKAARHFGSVGMKTKVLSSPEAAELAKLTETTYFGLLIVWAQEVERYCDQLGLDYDEIVSFYEEIPFFPPIKYFPGAIGGHCVMPNIAILKTLYNSELLDTIEISNNRKLEKEMHSMPTP